MFFFTNYDPVTTSFAVTCYTTVSGGVSSFTAQNIGARRYERVPQGFRAGVFLLLLLVTPIALVFFFFAPRSGAGGPGAESVSAYNGQIEKFIL